MTRPKNAGAASAVRGGRLRSDLRRNYSLYLMVLPVLAFYLISTE